MSDDDGKVMVVTLPEARSLGGDHVWRKIDLNALRANLEDLVASVEKIMPAHASETTFRMTEIQVAVTIGAEGQVGILGTGVKASADASMTLTLSRQ